MPGPVKLLLALAVAAGMVVLTPGTSWACSCALGSTEQQVARAGTIVDGTLKWVATNGIETTYSVQVAKVYKGKAAEREKLVGNSSDASCGLGSLATDERYLFFIQGEHPGQMRVSLCGGSDTYSAARAAAVEAVTGAPTGPFATPGSKPGAVDEDPIDGTHWYTVVGTGTAVAVVLGGLLLYSRRTGR